MIRYDALVDYFEGEHGVAGLEYIVPVETIQGIQNCEDIASASTRVGAIIGPTAEHADIAKAVGFEWSPEGTESLFHRTKIMLATKAVGAHALTALWERIHDLDGLRDFTTAGRQMGFPGRSVNRSPLSGVPRPSPRGRSGWQHSELLTVQELARALRAIPGLGRGGCLAASHGSPVQASE